MSAHKHGGNVDNRYHSETEWLAFCRAHPLVLEWLREPYRLSHDYDIPYLGGISKDGATVFLDRRYHPLLVCPAHKHTINSAQTIPDHEITEYVCIRFYGMQYNATDDLRNPHVWGNTAERLGVMALGCGWDEYNAVLDRQLSGIELENLTRCPPSLATYPYQDNPKLLAKIRAAQQEG